MRTLAPFATLVLLAGCTVGPNYAGAPKPLAAGDAPATFARGANATTAQAPVAGRWWTTLGDAPLDELETRALAANPGIAVAQARMRQARAAVRLERANALPGGAASARYVHAEIPGVDLGSLTGSREEGSSNESPTSLDFYNLGFDASWEIDLFGGQRRTVEAARASLAAAEANVADTQVQLTAEVAQAYVNLRDRQLRLQLAKQASEMQRQMLELTRQRRAQGVASQLEVEQLEGQVRSTDAQLVPIGAEIEAYQNALAVLTGAAPGTLDAMLATPGAIPLPPAAVAVGDPAALLQRRPDIRAAERQLAASTARIGVAEASRFPRLSFMGILGLGGTSPSALTNLDNLAALAMPTLQWSFLDFGRGAARVRQAEGARDEAEATYRQAVLRALQDAEDSLSRFGHRRETLASLAQVKAAADRAAALMQQRYGAGTATRTQALDAERNRLAAEQNVIAATAGLTTDYVALQKALGLGWDAPAQP
ncbi:efflux transporter outer membrane subunit [Sphingomonas sp. CJ20]